MPEQKTKKLNFSILASLAAIASLAMCFGEVLIILLLALLQVQNELADMGSVSSHIQAGLMWSLALVSVIALKKEKCRHNSNAPLLTALLGLMIMIGTLYGYYHPVILSAAYICLIAAVFINQILTLRTLNNTIRSQAQQLHQQNKKLS